MAFHEIYTGVRERVTNPILFTYCLIYLFLHQNHFALLFFDTTTAFKTRWDTFYTNPDICWFSWTAMILTIATTFILPQLHNISNYAKRLSEKVSFILFKNDPALVRVQNLEYDKIALKAKLGNSESSRDKLEDELKTITKSHKSADYKLEQFSDEQSALTSTLNEMEGELNQLNHYCDSLVNTHEGKMKKLEKELNTLLSLKNKVNLERLADPQEPDKIYNELEKIISNNFK